MKLRNTRRDHTDSEDIHVANYQKTTQTDYIDSPPPYVTVPPNAFYNHNDTTEYKGWEHERLDCRQELKRKWDANIEDVEKHGAVNFEETSPAPTPGPPSPTAATPPNNLTMRPRLLQEAYEYLISPPALAIPESNLHHTRRIRLNANYQKATRADHVNSTPGPSYTTTARGNRIPIYPKKKTITEWSWVELWAEQRAHDRSQGIHVPSVHPGQLGAEIRQLEEERGVVFEDALLMNPDLHPPRKTRVNAVRQKVPSLDSSPLKRAWSRIPRCLARLKRLHTSGRHTKSIPSTQDIFGDQNLTTSTQFRPLPSS